MTKRLLLRRWRETDRASFAAMHRDREVMDDLGGPITEADSSCKFDGYVEAWAQYGFGRWAVESDGEFLGYVGVMPHRGDHPLGPHDEIGWRLDRRCWGHGYATEAAVAALRDAFDRVGLSEVLAYTAPENLRSQAVMDRLGLRREASRDFSMPYAPLGVWHGLVWVADARLFPPPG